MIQNIKMVRLLLFCAVLAGAIQAQVLRRNAPFVSRAAESKINGLIKPPDKSYIDQRIRFTHTPGKAIESHREKALKKLANGERIGLFYPTDGKRAKIHVYNGKGYPSINDNMHTLAFVYTLDRSRVSDADVPTFQRVETAAQSWYTSNQAINYIPLKIYYLKYWAAVDSARVKDTVCEYFSVIPHKEGASSQLITFGFEPDFFLTNTKKFVVRIELSIEGQKYTLNPRQHLSVGFEQGDHAVKCDVVTNDGETMKSMFTFNVQPLSGDTWTNSIVNADGELEFIYQ